MTTGIVYIIETKRELFWSPRKMDAMYKHITFLYKDHARMKEMEEERFKSYCTGVKKRVIQLEDS